MKKKLSLLMTFMLCFIFGAWADTSTLTFTKACGGSGTADDGVAWTVSSDGTESAYDRTKGIHYGTGSAAVQYIKLTTSGITGTITSVKVNASTASGVAATVDVTVGGDAFGGDAQSLSSTAADYTFTGSASGEIVVNVSKPASAVKALYVKSIEVTYTPAGGDDPDPQEGEEKTVTFINDANWEHVYVHAWNNDGNITGEWPGVEITLTEGAYTWTTTANPTGIIFNNGNNGQQTSDYEFADGATYNTKGRLYTYTATFTTTADWESVYAYAWSGDGAAKKEFIGSWPGTPIEEVNGVYTVTITDTEAPTKIIFNNGNSGEGNQTEDLDFVNGKRYNYFQTGSADNPLTIAQAIAAIDAGIPTSIEVFVKGIVSKVESFNDKYSSITYWISDDGESQQFEVYSGKGLNGADFTSIDDVKVGANVVIKGSIKKYGTTYEFDKNNELVKYEAPAQELNTYTATFINTGRWNEVYAYAWSGDGETAVKFLGDWPGTKLNINDQTGMYEVTIEAAEAPQKIIFNDGANTKTEDLVFENGGRYSYVEPQTQKYTIYVDDGMVNGTVVPNKTEAAEGEEVILTVKPHEGFELETLTVTAGQETTITVTGGKFTMPAADVFVSATFKEAEALVINSMAIVGDFTGGWPMKDESTGEWDWSMAKPMTHIDEQPAIWALEIKGFEAEAKTYEFKAAANGKYGDYDLPAQGNKDFTFGTDMYPAGKYDLLFKADTEHHELNLYATKVEEPQPEPELIVVGNNADIFGAEWDTESTANALEFIEGKYYRTYQNVQPQNENIQLKAYNKANGAWFGDINNNGGNIVFNMKETGDFTVVLDVNADFTEGNVWVDGDNVIYPEPQPQPTSKEVTMKYTGTTTTNMTGGNDAELLGLDESEWSVIGDKGSSNNLPGLNRDGTMRLYWNTNGSNTITVSSLSNATINSITLDLKTNNDKICVKVGDNIISGTNGTYAINSSSFVLGNANTSNVQVHIKSVTINYTEGTPELKTFTATFTTNADWEKVYAYAWSGTEGQEDFKMFLGDWPGTELTKNDEGVYTVTVTDYKRPGKIIFNNGADQQTEDLDFRDGKHYLYIMKGTIDNPLTVAQAIKALDLESSVREVYVQGIVSDKIEELLDDAYITYWISTDGTTNGQQFMIERGSDYLGQSFKSIDDIEVGAKVVVYGSISKYVDEQQGILEYKFGSYVGELAKYEPLQNFTASFTTDQGWEKVYAYAWRGEEPNVQEYLGSWPGTDISNKYNDNTNAYDLSFRAYEAPEYIIFNNGLEGDAQQKTKNLVFENGKTYGLSNKNVILKGATEWDDNNNWTVMRDVELTLTEENTYRGELDLSDHKGDYQFKLFINDGNHDTWLGTGQLNWDERPDYISDAGLDEGKNFQLDHNLSEYRSYTITATWNEDAEKPWTLKIEGKDLRSTPITLIDYPTSTDGITLHGNSSFELGYGKKPYISLSPDNDTYITLTTDGGFKVGDIISLKAEQAVYYLYTLAEDNSVVNIHSYEHTDSDMGDNYLLKKDYDKLYLRVWEGSHPGKVYGLVVERPYETPVIHKYTITGNFTDNEIEMTEDPYSTEDHPQYTCTVKNVVIHNGETITYQAREDNEVIADNFLGFYQEGKYILTFNLSYEYDYKWHVYMYSDLQMAEIASVNLFGEWNRWQEGLTLTKGEDNVYTGTLDLSETLDNQKFKLLINDGEQNYWLGSDVTIDDASKDLIVATGDKDDNLLLKNATSGYKTYTVTATWIENTEADKQWTLKIVGDEARPMNTYAINFKTNIPETKWAKVYAYLWSGEGEDKIEYVGGWPGKEINYAASAEDGDIFTATFKAATAPAYIVFSDGTTEGSVVGVNQSKNFAFEDAKQYTWNEYAVTFTTNAEWQDVYAYAWSGEKPNVVEYSGEWPGKNITATEENEVYTYALQEETAPEFIIFNNGANEQTEDLAFENGKAYEYIVEVPQPLLGDANLNGEVTTSDAVLAVSFALKKEQPSDRQFLAADVDKDNEITVADAKGIVNIALEIEPESEGNNGNHAIANSYLTLDGQTLNLMNAIAFAGFQMDVTLADGALLNGAELADRAAGMMLGYNRISDNTWRIVALSLDETTMSGNEGALLKLDIFGNSNISVSNIMFVDAAARAYRLDFMGETTGINGVKSISGDADIYNVNGVRTNTTSKGVNIIRNANGKVQKVFVK